MTVQDVVSACEYTGCVVVNQLGEEVKINNNNKEEIYDKSVEHVDAANELVRIWTFDKIDELEGINEENMDKYVRANPKWDSLMSAVLRQIERELERCYWNKNQTPLESPFANTGNRYSNDEFKVRAYNWDNERDGQPNFEWGPIQVYWYKHEGRGNVVYAKMGYDSPAIYGIMLDKCLKSIRKDFEDGKDI